MSWLAVTISAYFVLAVVFLIDKYLLTGSIPNPKIYTFYIGVLGILALLLIPFVNFSIPEPSQIFLSLLAGALFICGILWFNKALKQFEASRVVPAVGGILPLFTFFLIYLFSGGKEMPESLDLLAFSFLILGSILIVYKKTGISFKSFQISLLAAFFLALSFVLAKYVYLAQPFWSGYIWIRIGGFLAAMSFLFLHEVRGGLSRAKIGLPKKTVAIFLSNQAVGAGANILQNWAIALTPLAYIPFINALQGVQYVFLLFLAALVSFKLPQIIKEEISREILLQKIIAVLLIGGGLTLLAI